MSRSCYATSHEQVECYVNLAYHCYQGTYDDDDDDDDDDDAESKGSKVKPHRASTENIAALLCLFLPIYMYGHEQCTYIIYAFSV